MDEYILHEEYYKSIRGEDGEEPLAVHGSRRARGGSSCMVKNEGNGRKMTGFQRH